ncbi:unnamed protein product [Sphenostylis stenocarpa]|uniref:NAB domain-containing protein n=1 Tax=Sphenostylis stenocarpa TaxID=92480 RepID=A0AA86VW18_9FABA|nr:unnamed protein product [Sphenostylis stenocarpa]
MEEEPHKTGVRERRGPNGDEIWEVGVEGNLMIRVARLDLKGWGRIRYFKTFYGPLLKRTTDSRTTLSNSVNLCLWGTNSGDIDFSGSHLTWDLADQGVLGLGVGVGLVALVGAQALVALDGVLALVDLVGVRALVAPVGVRALVALVGVLEDRASLGLVGFLVGVLMVYAAFYLHASTACAVVGCSKIVSSGDAAQAQACRLHIDKKPTNLSSYVTARAHSQRRAKQRFRFESVFGGITWRRTMKKENMAENMKNQPSLWWWLDSHITTNRSPWLQSTLSELNEKTRAMLKLIEEDADSFAKRAEMYYKKRPELVSMVEDLYRTHRSLAERYDQVKPDTTGIGHIVTGGSPFAAAKYQIEKLMTFSDTGYDTYSEHCDVYESEESEVDDPEQEDEEEEEGTDFLHNCTQKEQASLLVVSDEVMKLRDEVRRLNEENKDHRDQIKEKNTICDEVMMLREEIERLRDENETQKEQLKQKDEAKIEVIRQLSLAIDVLKQENVKMRNFIAKESTNKWKKPFDEINKLVGEFSMKLFNGAPKNQPSVELSRCGLKSFANN